MRRLCLIGLGIAIGAGSIRAADLPSRVSLEGPWKVLAGDLLRRLMPTWRVWRTVTGTPFKFRETGISRAGITPASSTAPAAFPIGGLVADRLMQLTFEAVDYAADVWLNATTGQHEGY